MSRRSLLTLAAAPAFLQPKTQPPNIILILTDDQGWWDLGAHGNTYIETPHLDRLAEEGISFQRFYVSPVCAPTRATLMTGRSYLRTGIYNTRFGGDTMDAGEITIAELLRAQLSHGTFRQVAPRALPAVSGRPTRLR